MYSLSDVCCLCLEQNLNFQSILSKDIDGIVVEEKLRIFLLELVNFKPNIQKYICGNCLVNLNFIYKFRQKCLENIIVLDKYVQNSDSCTETNINVKEDSFENQNNYSHINSAVESVFIKAEPEFDSDASSTYTEENSQTISPEDIVKVEIEETGDDLEDKNIADNNSNLNTTPSELPADSPKNLTKQDRLKCPECSKTFTGPGHLKLHLRVHSQDRIHKCPTCNKIFKDASDLKRHCRVHTGEKPYACSVCSKAFTQLSHLTGHKRIHDNVRPYKCPVCNETFTQNGGLTRHMRRHTGEKPFHCQLCQYKCTTRSNLHIHMRTHTKEKPYTCDVCRKCFVASNSLHRHVLRSHRDVTKSAD